MGSHLPAVELSPPVTLLSKFIFIDTQSPNDLGLDADALCAVARNYKNTWGTPQFLFEPRAFYDTCISDDAGVPSYASYKNTCIVDGREFVGMAKRAARENSKQTPFCEPTFQRENLLTQRDEENCFRYVEEAIGRGAEVTVLARPKPVFHGNRCRITLVPPTDGKLQFRILKGYSIDRLLGHRSLNLAIYYGAAAIGFFFTMWSVAGFPGPSGGLQTIAGVPA